MEVLTVFVVLGVLGTLLLKAIKQPRNAVEKVACIANLRSIHIGLNSYITDHKEWPQMPPALDNQKSAEWWIEALRPYLGEKKVWQCPTFQRQAQENPQSGSEHLQIDYIPTDFDERPMTPFKWANMPWVMEVGDFHGSGNLAVFPDGSVRTIWEAYKLQHPDGVIP